MSRITATSAPRSANSETSESASESTSSRSERSASTPRYVQDSSVTTHAANHRARETEARLIERREAAGASGELQLENPIPEDDQARESAQPDSGAETDTSEEQDAASQQDEESAEQNEEGGDSEMSLPETGAAGGNGEDAANHSGGAQHSGEEAKSQPVVMLAAELPSLAPIRAPYVGSPPLQALARRDQIIKRTGAPPELNHAQVRQRAQQVTQFARDQQRRMLFRVGDIAGDLRSNIEDMADEVAKATGQAIGHVNAHMDSELKRMRDNTREEIEFVRDNEAEVSTEAEEKRDKVTTAMYAQLSQGSEAIEQLRPQAEAIYSGKLGVGLVHLPLIPVLGEVGRVPPIGDNGVEHPEGENKILSDADAEADDFITNKAKEVAGGKVKAREYITDRAEAVLNGRSNAQSELLREANAKAITRLNEPAVKDEFMIRVLGMTTPAREDYDQDAAKARGEAWAAEHNELGLIEHATKQAVFQLEEKQRMAEDYCKEYLRPKLTGSLRKQGTQAEDALRKQARQAEMGLNTSAAHMAEDYRNLIARLDQMLPPGQFLDARKKVPQIMALRDKLEALLRLHEGVAEAQSEQTRQSHLEMMRDQIEALMKAAHDGAEGITDVVTRVDFDMAVFAQQTTGEVREEADDAFKAARALADETARSMLSTNGEVRATAAENIGNAAAALINQHIHSAENRQFQALDSYLEGLTEGQNNGHLGAELVAKDKDLRDAAEKLNNQIPERDLEDMGSRAVDSLASFNPARMAWDAASLGYELYETDPDENAAVTILAGFLHPGPAGVAEHFPHFGRGALVDVIQDRVHDPQKRVMVELIQAQSATAHAAWAMYGISESARWYDPWALNRDAREALGSSISEEGYQGLQSSEAGQWFIDQAQEALSGEWWQTGMNQDEQDIALAYVDHNRERVIAARTREALRKGRLYASFGFIFSSEEAIRRTEDARTEALQDLHADLQRELEIEAGYVSQNELADHLDMMYQEVASLEDGRGRDRDEYEASEGREDLRTMATEADYSYVIGVSPMLDLAANQMRLINALTDRDPSAAEEDLFSVTSRIERTEISQEAEDYINAMIDAQPGSGKEAEQSRRDRDAAHRAFVLKRTEESNALGQYGELMVNFGIPGASMLMESEFVESLTIADQNRMTSTFENTTLDSLDRQIETETDPAERRRLQQQRIEEYRRHQQTMQDTARELGAPKEIWSDPERATAYMERRVGDVFARADNHVGDSAPVSAARSGWQSLFGGAALPFTTPEGYSHRTYGEELIRGGRASIEASTALASEGIGTNETLLQSSWQNRSPQEWAEARKNWQSRYGESIETSMGIQGRDMSAADWALMVASPGSWFLLRGGEVSGDLAMELERHSQNDGTDRGMLDVALLRDVQQRVRGTGILGSQFMDGSVYENNLKENRAELGRLMLDTVTADHPELAAQFEGSPADVFDPNNAAGQRVLDLAFDENRRFRGDRTRLAQLSGYMEIDARAYSNELDRQERIITGAISVLAMIAVAVVTAVAMFIPGVNVAVAATVAGVASAIIAGTATMAVKAGMRSERYGWEEAATDTAMMAIEAAAAGVGGALAGGAGSTGIGGVLGRAGSSLSRALGESALGKAVSAAARESAVAMVSGMAQTALQDGTWDMGFSRGLENMVGGGLRSATVAAVTAGVSEGISERLTGRGATARFFNQLDNMPPKMRSSMMAGRSVVAEAASEFIGTAAGESIGIGIDYGRGVHRGGFWDALQTIGTAALRDAGSGAIRGIGGTYSLHKGYSARAYRHTLQAFRDGDVQPTREQLAASLLLGRSAGILDGGANIQRIQHEIRLGRELIAGLPTALRDHANGFEVRHLQMLHAAIRQGGFGDGSPQQFRSDFEQDFPGLDSVAFMKELNGILALRSKTRTQGPSSEEAIRVREAINGHLGTDLQRILSEQAIDGLQHLSPEDLAIAARMIAGGVFKGETADALFAKAKQNQPELDEATFLSHLMGATHAVREAREMVQQVRAQQHQAVMAHLAKESRGVFAQLGHENLALVHQMMISGEIPAHQRRALFEAARQKQPELSEQDFNRALKGGVESAQQRLQTQRKAVRVARAKTMGFVPEEHRGTLSILPSDMLLMLRVKQHQGQTLSPNERTHLIQAAQKQQGEVDLRALHQAVEATLKQPPPELDAAQAQRLREEMLAGVPRDERHKVDDVPILMLRDSEFEVMTRSQKGDAVTMIVHGQPVVVMREGADPAVLREEGIHALQSRDPDWAERIGSLDERHLADWDALPLAEQLRLYRNKLALEIDAQQRVIKSLQTDMQRTQDPAARQRLQQRLGLIELALGNLLRRQVEANAIGPSVELAILAGHRPRPQWLDQPARLFGKRAEERIDTEPITETEQHILTRLTANLSDAEAAEIRRFASHLTLQQLRVIAHPTIPAAHSVALLRKLGSPDTPKARLAASTLARTLGSMTPGQRRQVIEHLSNAHISDHFHYIVQLGRLHGAVDADLFPRIVELVFRDGEKNATWLHKQRLTQFAELAGIIGSDGIRDLSAVAPGPEHLRALLEFVGKQTNRREWVQMLVGVLVNVDSGEKRLRALEWFVNPRSGDTAEVIRGLDGLRQYLVSPETYSAMIDVVLGAGRKTDVIEHLTELAGNLDMEGRRALADLGEHVGDSDKADVLRELLDHHEAIDALQNQLDPQRKNALFNLILEMAADVAVQRSQWRVFMEQSVDVLRSLSELPQGQEFDQIRRTVLEYLYSVKSETPAGAGAGDLAKRPAYPDRLLRLATDLTAAAKQLQDKESSELLPPESRQDILRSQVKSLDNDDFNKRHLASDDPWMARLIAEGARYGTQSQRPEFKAFSALAQAVRGDWDAKQLGMMLKLAPWYTHIASKRGLDLNSTHPADIRRLKGILVELMVRPKLIYELKKRGIDIHSRDPDDVEKIQRIQAELMNDVGQSQIKDLMTEDRFVDLQRAFREVATEADIAADAEHAQKMADKRTHILKHVGMTEAELKNRSDRTQLEAHLDVLVRRQLYYDRMKEVAATMKDTHPEDIAQNINAAGIQQNITETRGEIALTMHILKQRNTPRFRGFLLAMRYGKGTGFDQVWIRTDSGTLEGGITEVLIGEAKGPGASLEDPAKGPQMGARWVAETLREMATSSDKTTRALAKRLLEAQRTLPRAKFHGMVVEAVKNAEPPPPPFVPNDISDSQTGKGGWDFTEIKLHNPTAIS